MNIAINKLLITATLTIFSASVLASEVTLPTTFVDGNVLTADQLNNTNNAIKTAVDDNQSQITALEAKIDRYFKKVLFITSATHDGDFTESGTYPDGLTGADAFCNTVAANNPALDGRVFKALVSTSSVHMKDRVVHAADKEIILPSGTVIAKGTAPLFNAYNIPLPVAPNEFEDGTSAGGATAWTASIADGTWEGETIALSCSDWTDNTNSAVNTPGLSSRQDGAWILDNYTWTNTPCNSVSRLYCLSE